MSDKRWRQVVLTRRMTADGGYARSARTVVSTEWPCGGRMVSFVRINKTSLWLLQFCHEKGAQKGGLRTTRVIENLRGLCQGINTENGMDDTPEKPQLRT